MVEVSGLCSITAAPKPGGLPDNERLMTTSNVPFLRSKAGDSRLNLPTRRLDLPTRRLDRRQVLLALSAPTWPALAQTPVFPTHAISLLVPFGPGGIADLTARAVAQVMSASLGQALVVDNRPSAGSIVASQLVANAAPDGHTLLLLSNGHAVGVSLFRKLPFDVQKDFAPVCLLASFDLALFVAAGSRFKTLGQLLDEARARPGKLTLGSVAVGSTQHLAAEWMKQLAGIDALVVPYKGTPAVLGALRGGEIDAAFEIIGPWLPQVGGGVLRALAVSSAQRFADLPQVPTVVELGQTASGGVGGRAMSYAGLQHFKLSSWNALAAPARTPPEVILRLNQAANGALAQPAVQRQLRTLGVRPQGGTPDQLRQWLAAEIRQGAELVRGARIEPS